MAGDPALKQVVSRSWEAGLRGSLGALKHWGIGLFRADNADDILFVAHSAATGYFRNFGKTRRQGLEISAAGRIERLSLSANYTYLQATYQSAETVNSPFNSAADSNGFIAISPGKRLPLLPSQMLKLRADYQLTPQIETGLDLLAVNAAYVRGNDNNVQDSGGKVPGHTVANWSGSYQASPATRLFANVSNLFDRRYASAGQLGPLAFAAGGAFTNSDSKGTTFYSPGAPRIIWLGVQHSFK
jgi:outer membrane receptor protein involved in Fe transport